MFLFVITFHIVGQYNGFYGYIVLHRDRVVYGQDISYIPIYFLTQRELMGLFFPVRIVINFTFSRVLLLIPSPSPNRHSLEWTWRKIFEPS